VDRRPSPSREPAGEFGRGERVVLTAIAQHKNGVTKEQLTVLTGYKRSTRDLYVQKLAAGGFVVREAARIHATGGGSPTSETSTVFRPGTPSVSTG
jgi:hypothetical protein